MSDSTDGAIPWLRSALVRVGDPAFGQELSQLLRRCGASEVNLASDCGEAADSLGGERGGFDLVVCDLGLEGVAGSPLLSAVRRPRPGPRLLLLAGPGVPPAGMEKILSDADAFLIPPFDETMLLQALLGIDRRRVARERFLRLAWDDGLSGAFDTVRDWARDRTMAAVGGSVNAAARELDIEGTQLRRLLASWNPEIDLKSYPVLCVDDDPPVLKTLQYSLCDKFTVLTTPSGSQALEFIERNDVAVLLADIRMPGMDGIELCARALEVAPQVVRLVMTAHADRDQAIAAINRGRVSGFLQKPWGSKGLDYIVRSAVMRAHEVRAARIDRST